MKKLLVVLLVLCVSLTTVFAGGSTETKPAASNEPIKIGYTSYLTGAYAAYMVWSRAGVNMAVKEINDAGGINGRQIELVHIHGENPVNPGGSADFLPEGKDGIERHLEMLDAPGNAHERHAEDESAHQVDQGDFPPSQQDPDQIHHDGHATGLVRSVD